MVANRLLRKLLGPPAFLAGFRVEGASRLPRQRRALILACNHASYSDTVYVSLAIRPRFVLCGAKPRLFRDRRRRALMAVANAIEVRGLEQYLADCQILLGRGEILLTYPEMGRNPDGLGTLSTWPAEVALATKTPILPMYLHGTTRGHEGPVRLRVGRELAPTGTAEDLTEVLGREILALGATAAE